MCNLSAEQISYVVKILDGSSSGHFHLCFPKPMQQDIKKIHDLYDSFKTELGFKEAKIKAHEIWLTDYLKANYAKDN